MSSESQDRADSIGKSQTEHYNRVSASLRVSAVLSSVTGLLFGFLLDIAVNNPSYFSLNDRAILLTSLFSVTFATTLYILPILYYQIHFKIIDVQSVERLLFKTKAFIIRGTIWLEVTLYLCLILALERTLSTPIAFGTSEIPFIFIMYQFSRRMYLYLRTKKFDINMRNQLLRGVQEYMLNGIFPV